MDPLLNAPTKYITARRLGERVKENAFIVPLFDDFKNLQGYRIDCSTGPYLMTTDETGKYRAKFKVTPDLKTA